LTIFPFRSYNKVYRDRNNSLGILCGTLGQEWFKGTTKARESERKCGDACPVKGKPKHLQRHPLEKEPLSFGPRCCGDFLCLLFNILQTP